MKTTTAYFKLSVFSPMLFLSIVACAPVQNHGMPTGIRPVAPTSDTLATTDEVEYQGAVRAIYDRDYGRALDYLQAARNMQASDVRVLNAFGVVYDKLGRFDLSARYYTQALAADPHSAIVLKNVAYSRVLQGMVDGHTAAVMAAASPPVPAAQAPSNDLPLERTAIMAHAELAMDPQMLSGGHPRWLRWCRRRRSPKLPTAFKFRIWHQSWPRLSWPWSPKCSPRGRP